MNKIEKHIAITIGVVIGCFLAWYFRSILIYLAVAGVVALIGRPLMILLGKIRIRKFHLPKWISALFTIFVILSLTLSVLLLLSPLIAEIAGLLGSLDPNDLSSQIQEPLSEFNNFLIGSFPSLGDDFRIEMVVLSHLQELFSFSTFSQVFSSVTNFVAGLSVALFSVIFISFFFLIEDGIITDTIIAVSADRYGKKIRRASESIKNLLTRYFLGIIIESLCISILNGVGLIFIARMPVNIAIVVASITGIINVVPYVGPLVGDIIALLMGVITHYSSGLESSLGLYLLLILIVVVVTQLIDNYVFQPLIYSSSVKAHPLEVFIVILMAGHLGGVLGMLIAIPCYTVIRVIAGEFLSKYKAVRKLTHSIKEEDEKQ